MIATVTKSSIHLVGFSLFVRFIHCFIVAWLIWGGHGPTFLNTFYSHFLALVIASIWSLNLMWALVFEFRGLNCIFLNKGCPKRLLSDRFSWVWWCVWFYNFFIIIFNLDLSFFIGLHLFLMLSILQDPIYVHLLCFH